MTEDNLFETAYEVNRIIQSIAFQISVHNMNYDNFYTKFEELYKFVSGNLNILFTSKILYTPIVIRSKYESDNNIYYFLDRVIDQGVFKHVSDTNSELGVDVVCILGISDITTTNSGKNEISQNMLSISIMYPTGKTYCMASELKEDDGIYYIDEVDKRSLVSDEVGLYGIEPWVGGSNG